jgi:hypothetical protein
MRRLNLAHASDSVLSSLLGVSLVALGAAVLLAGRSEFAMIPDPYPGHIRGLNPQTMKVAQLNCTILNVQTLNLFDPPGGPPTSVAFYDCAHGLNENTICIACNAMLKNYIPQQRQGGMQAINSSQGIINNCGPNGGGVQGTCIPDAGNRVAFDCNTTGADYPNQ